ncbi:hypothetical protein OC834_004627 [Tilletia horrida]|nr:hypothetical protein OC834_004627 [Tilletia horrida]
MLRGVHGLHAASQRSSTLPQYQSSRALAHATRASSYRTPALPALSNLTAPSVVVRVWLSLVSRLRETKVPVNPALLTSRHRFVDPSAADPALWQRLLDSPMQVSDAEIAQMLPLTPAVSTDTPANDGSHGFYLRSFPLEVRQLRRIIGHWVDEDVDYDEARRWAEATARHQDDDFVYIRYVGTFGPQTTALKRHESDISHRTSGVLAAFLRTLATELPEVLDAAKVYTFPSAILEPLFADVDVPQSLVDERERLLIALFGLPTLLNRQTGGFLPVWEPREEDAVLFANLQSCVLSQGLLDLRSVDVSIHGVLEELSQDIVAFMKEHPVLTGTSRLPPSPGLPDLILKQGMPSTINGFVLLALIGKDITLEDYLQPRPFLQEGESRAGHLLYTLINTLQQWELGLDASIGNTGTKLAALFPFFDLIPWPRHDISQASIDFLGRYLRTVKPLVTVTCSQLVSSVLAADLVHDQGLPRANFLQHVGVPRLCNYMDPQEFIEQEPEVEDRDPQAVTIVVPSLHPGRDKYGSQPDSLRRVMLLTMQVAVALADLCRTTSRTAISRADAVQRAWSVWRTSPAYNALAAELEGAKAHLRADWSTVNAPIAGLTREMTEEEHAQRSFSAQSRAKAFIAEGPPNSPARATQALQLWRSNWPDLHIRIRRDNKEEWFAWVNGLREGRSFFASAIASSPLSDKLFRLCQQWAPGEDYNDPIVRQHVIELATSALRHGWAADRFSSEKQAARGRQRRGWRKQGELVTRFHFTPVSLWIDGRFQVSLDIRESAVDVELRAPPEAVPDNVKDERFLMATEEGLNLIDQDQQVFKFKSTDVATWDKAALARNTKSAALQYIWENTMGHPDTAATGDSGSTATEGGSDPVGLILPASFYGDKDLTATISRTRRDLRQAAPEPNEPDWIFWTWLEEEFGNEPGRLFLCRLDQEEHWSPKLATDIKMVRSRFSSFVQRPTYAHYPWREEWLSLLAANGGVHSAKKILSTLGALRTFTQTGRGDRVQLAPNARLALNGKLLTLAAAPEWSVASTAPEQADDVEEEDEEGDE